jgi:branched-chain amino acid transport system substrate-binding protein
MMVLTEALKIADKKGQLNGPGVKAALESLKNFDTGGLAANKITITETDHRPFMTVNVTEFQKGKMVLKKTLDLPRKPEWLGL